MALPWGISITDISVIHPLSFQILSCAADTAGADTAGVLLRPKQEDRLRTSLAQWLWLGALLHGDVRTLLSAGDDTPAPAWR
jgi:hypothetical protein